MLLFRINFITQTSQRISVRKMSMSGSIHELDNDTAKTVSTSTLKARFEGKASEGVHHPVKRNFVVSFVMKSFHLFRRLK